MAGKMSRVRFAPVGVDKVETPDDGFILRAQAGLGDYPDTLCHHVEHQAATAPDRDFLAERADDGAWRRITYGGFRDTARTVAAGLLTRGIGADSPAMILSDNGIDNALMQFGAMYAGIPAAPVSPAYSLMSQDHAKLRFIFDLLKPKLVFAENGAAFAAALSVLDLDGVEVVLSRNPPDGVTATAFSDFCQAEEGPEVAAACAALGAGTTAKILFTSGSTGFPKGVINTHGMMCSNQQAMAQVWPFLEDRPPVLLDWLPWHHTFGGNHNLNMVLRNGGTLLHRRRQAGARPDRHHHPKPARGPADALFQCTARLRHGAAPPGGRSGPRRQSVRGTRPYLLCRRGVAAEPLGTPGDTVG